MTGSPEQTFCPLPWASLSLRNDGSYRVCCQANVSKNRGLLRDSLGKSLNAAKDSIETARNSVDLKQVRSNMLAGVWDSSCSRCQTEEAAGLRSRRMYSSAQIENTFTLEDAKAATAADGSIEISAIPLRDLDLRFGNTCNLKCRMCGPQDSSSWVQDYKVLFPKDQFELSNMNWFQSTQFWEELKSHSHSVRHIYVVGGEPLMIKKHFEFLEWLSAEGHAKNISLEYNTNLTILPPEGSKAWPSFKRVSFGVSIDGFGAVNDYIRYPSDFQTIEHNINALKKSSNFHIWVSATVSIYSILSLVDLAEWTFKTLGQNPGAALKNIFKSHALHRPLAQNLQALRAHEKAYVEQTLSLQIDRLKEKSPSTELIEFLEMTIDKYIRFMHAKDLSSNHHQFVDYTLKLDTHRKQNFASLYPELSEMVFSR